MRHLVIVVVALAMALSVVPAMAGDKSVSGTELAALQALSKMPAPERTALITMTDKELASIEGARFEIEIASNRAKVKQVNRCLACLGVFQSNSAFVYQTND
jgi:hypothetical protein